MSHIRGRFQKGADKTAEKYTASIAYDWRLYPYDIAGSIAHARMLAKQGIISSDEATAISNGLTEIGQEITEGKFQFKAELEDIHMNIEVALIEKIGETGGKLHTARSRNDQVALDMRLFVKESIIDTLLNLKKFQRALVSLAEANSKTLIPGYTHLQRAQPVLFAHHLLAYFEMLRRDTDRFIDCMERTDTLPLGSGALAGVAYNIDREFLAEELGFGSISRNSMDAVSDRDFVLEYEAAASICMTHLSRLAEEIILWSSSEFDFIELDDAFATSSSIMPQKKNPDVAELIRGRTGRVYGCLMALLTTLKGLPLSYNRDLQEDKEGLFTCVDTLLSSLEVFSGLIETLKVKGENTGRAAGEGYLLATDLADYLVGKGEAFRTAYDIVAKLVNYAAGKNKSLAGLKLDEYRQFSSHFGEDVFSVTLESSLAARNSPGGTSPERVAEALAEAKDIMDTD